MERLLVKQHDRLLKPELKLASNISADQRVILCPEWSGCNRRFIRESEDNFRECPADLMAGPHLEMDRTSERVPLNIQAGDQGRLSRLQQDFVIEMEHGARSLVETEQAVPGAVECRSAS